MNTKNKTRKKICVACDNNSKIEKDAKWVKQFTRLTKRIGAPIHTEHYKLLKNNNFPETFPLDSDICVTIKNNNHDFNKIFFFASKPVSLLSSVHGDLSGAEKAYDDYTNSGIAIKKNNKWEIKLCSPQPYLDDGILYERHIHYFDINNPKIIYTVSCIPDHDTVSPMFDTSMCSDKPSYFLCYEKTLMGNHMGALCINALKKDDGTVFNNDLHIPYTLNIQKIKDLLKGVQKHKTIIVYCYKPTCNAASQLIKKINTLGYTNIFYFPGGVEEKILKNKIINC